MAGTVTVTDEKDVVKNSIINNAAQYYRIPSDILRGVYGVETDFGKNQKTSTAGAKGPFQFIASTAKQYSYPYTNDSGHFNEQAYAAAHYLSDLKKRYGTWEAALQHYSGGGYGLQRVKDKLSGHKTPVVGDADDAGLLGIGRGPGLDTVAGDVADAAMAVPKFLGKITSQDFLLRAGKVVIGTSFILVGVVQLGKVAFSVDVTSPVKAAAKLAGV